MAPGGGGPARRAVHVLRELPEHVAGGAVAADDEVGLVLALGGAAAKARAALPDDLGEVAGGAAEAGATPAVVLQASPEQLVMVFPGDTEPRVVPLEAATAHLQRSVWLVMVLTTPSLDDTPSGQAARLALAALEALSHDVPVIVQGTLRFPKRDDSDYNQTFALPAKLKELGVRFCISSGEETPHERNTPYSAGMAIAHGLSEDDAMRAVTLSAAEILGVADHLGSLEKGKDATVIVTTGSPLEITTQVVDAFVDGKRIDLSNKQTKLYEKYKERYRQMGELKNETKPAAK